MTAKKGEAPKGPTKVEEVTTPHHHDSVSLAVVPRRPSDIAPDVLCPHCGWVILCPHCPPGDPYPPHSITPPPPRVGGNSDWDDYFDSETAGGTK